MITSLCFHLFLALISAALAVPLAPPEAYFVSFSDMSPPYVHDNQPTFFLLFGLLLIFMNCLLLQRLNRSV